MKKTALLILSLCVLLLIGCSRTITSENPDPPNREQIAEFTPEDIEKCVQTWIEDLHAFGPIAESATPPLVGYCSFKNMGSEHIELGEFERAFKYWGLRSKKIRFTSATDLPKDFFDQHNFQQSAMADKRTAVEIGKIKGWKYSLYGELFSSKPKNVKGDRIHYYEVYIYMLNIETGEEVWNSRKKFKLVDKKTTLGF